MEKSTLTQFEQRCIQEEPAFCTAACPFHVDVKTFLQHMAQRDFDKAFKVLEKTLPLPEVLSRICDHVCEAACVREPVDDPLAIGCLERICVRARSRQKKYFSPPAKGKTVGIWGTGASSLVAAWDLSLKGYKVTLFDGADQPCGHLVRLDAAILPPDVLDKEIDRLKKFGALFKTRTSYQEFEKQSDQFDALLIGLDTDNGPAPETCLDGVDAFSLKKGDTGVFYAGFSLDGLAVTTTSSPVQFAFQGRKAATSIDRILSGVSLDAGREKEGPYTTRLDTDLSRITPTPATGIRKVPAGQSPDPELAASEAARCHQCDCSRCIRACNSFIHSFGGFPGRYAREIYNNLSIVMGERKANLLTNSCTLCDLCTTVCPNDFSMAQLCLQARQQMIKDGRMPPSAHAFALQEMDHAMGDACFFAGHAKGLDHSDRMFFPGCQLVGSAPSQVAKAYAWLKDQTPATGIVAGCCSAPAFWAGRSDLFEKGLADFKALWEQWGTPEVVTACTSCSRMLEKIIPKEKIISLYRIMADVGCQPDKGCTGISAAVADPCTGREDKDIQDAVRILADRAGVAVSELAASGALTECCGFGGLTFNANPKMGKQIIQNRAGQSDLDYIAYCAMCRDRLAGTGHRTFHILDFFWPAPGDPCQTADLRVVDAAARPDPGFSLRRMNRVLFKAALVAGVMPADTADPQKDLVTPSGRTLFVPPEVALAMEEQFILLSDIKQVLDHFETDTLEFFTHTGKASRITNYRFGNVCFWVEFNTSDTSYEVLDTWAHRMTIVPSATFIDGKPDENHDPDLRCGACDAPLAFYKNHVEYLGSRFDVDLPQCRACGTVFISAHLSRTRMAEVEHILEDK